MQEIWFSGVKGKEDRDKIRQNFATASEAFKILSKLLESKLIEYSSDYDLSNWAYKQADTNGYNRAIREIMKLIKE